MLLKYTITYDILMSILIGQAVGFKHWHSRIGHRWSPRQVFFRLLRCQRIGTIIRSQQKRRAKIKIIQKRKWKLFYSLRPTQLRRKVWTKSNFCTMRLFPFPSYNLCAIFSSNFFCQSELISALNCLTRTLNQSNGPFFGLIYTY